MSDIKWDVFFPPGAQVSVLPNPYDRAEPRLATSGTSARQRWKASQFYPAFRWTGQIWRFGLRVMAAANRFALHQSNDSWALGAFVREVLPGVRHVTVLCGMPGPGQQFTVQLRDRRERVIGYLKYAESDVALSRLATEHHLLTALPPDTGARVLKYGAFHLGQAMVTAPLLGKPLASGQPPSPALFDFLDRLQRPVPPCPIREHPYLNRLPRDADTAPLYDALSNRPWPVVLLHGDLLPWNLRRGADGAIRAFDWEHGSTSGLPYIDLAYYTYYTARMVRKWPEARAEQYAAFLLLTEAPLPLSEREATALVRLCRLDAARHAQRHNPARMEAA